MDEIKSTKTTTTCTPRCWKALGKTCRCSCGGDNHGVRKQPGLFGEIELPNKEATIKKPKVKTFPRVVNAEELPTENVICPRLQVGDLVRIADGAPMGGEKAYVYEIYEDFDTKQMEGASLITESGRDTGGWSREEQKQWLTLLGKSGVVYHFENVIRLSADFQEGYFTEAFR